MMFRQPREGLGRYLDKVIVAIHSALPEYLTNKQSRRKNKRDLANQAAIIYQATNLNEELDNYRTKLEKEYHELESSSNRLDEENQSLQRENSALENKYQKLESETSKLKEENQRLQGKKSALEKKVKQNREQIGNLVGRRNYLLEEKSRLRKELALTRIGKGEDPETFSCPEAMAELTQRYKDLGQDYSRVCECKEELSRKTIRNSSRQYENLFDSLEIAGATENIALMYINPEGKISRVSKNISTLLKEIDCADRPISEFLYQLNSDDAISLIDLWKKDNSKYQPIEIDGQKIDIATQKALGEEEKVVGTFVYLRKHHLIKRNKKHRPIMRAVENLGSLLDKSLNLPENEQGLNPA